MWSGWLSKSTRPRTHLNLRGGHETLGREGNTRVTSTPSFLWRGEVLLRYRFERDAMGRGGMASARRDAFFLDLERDGMDGGGHGNHDFSMTYFLDAPTKNES